MDRRACADLPGFALQLLLAAHADWKNLPVAVVDADEATGTLLQVNEKARRSHLRPGMRHASALALDARLRAGTVTAASIDAAVTGILATLRSHTPHVEPSREEAGVFWLDASGLESLYASVDAWARIVVRAVAGAGFNMRLAVGFTRFGTYALARSLEGSSRRGASSVRCLLVCGSEEEERRLVRGVALERLGLEPGLRDALARLGVQTVGAFLDLPCDGIRRRFGEKAFLLHRRARGEAWDPLVPLAAEEETRRSVVLDDPVFDTGIVLFVVRRLLVQILEPLAARGQAAQGVTVTLQRSLRRDTAPVVLHVAAAEATLDEAVLLDLVRLRLEARARRELAGSSIVEIEVEVTTAPAPREQLRLFHERTGRSLGAASRAIARLRAELGDDAVVRAVLREGHLPEASFAWEAIDKAVAPAPRVVRLRSLVRRVYGQALALPPKPFRERDDCWIPPAASAAADVAQPRGTATTADRANAKQRNAATTAGRGPSASAGGAAHGRIDHMTGPYIVSGGWWNRELHREYHYARTEDGEMLWVYYDRRRLRWYLAGRIE